MMTDNTPNGHRHSTQLLHTKQTTQRAEWLQKMAHRTGDLVVKNRRSQHRHCFHASDTPSRFFVLYKSATYFLTASQENTMLDIRTQL